MRYLAIDVSNTRYMLKSLDKNTKCSQMRRILMALLQGISKPMGWHKKGNELATELCDESMDRNGAETGRLQLNVESDSTEAV
ncbi:hypothetical protein ACFX2C_034017 [Malus domestica]